MSKRNYLVVWHGGSERLDAASPSRAALSSARFFSIPGNRKLYVTNGKTPGRTFKVKVTGKPGAAYRTVVEVPS